MIDCSAFFFDRINGAQVMAEPNPGWSVQTHCYLCGELLANGAKTNKDHVPPRRLFPSGIRKNIKTNLLTLRTHEACQTAFARDEEYFFSSLLPNALHSEIGDFLAEDFKRLIQRDRPARMLAERVRRDFDPAPGGLILPRNLLILRVDGDRLVRIIWKFARGLFSNEHGRYVPADTPRSIKIIGPFDDKVEDYIVPLIARQRIGHTLSCFGHSSADSKELPEWDQNRLHMYLMEMWKSYLLFAAFHDPVCDCKTCKPPR